MDADVLEWFEERSAIIAEGTGQLRVDADFNAFACLVAWCKRNGKELPDTQYFQARRNCADRIYFNDEKGTADFRAEKPSWIIG